MTIPEIPIGWRLLRCGERTKMSDRIYCPGVDHVWGGAPARTGIRIRSQDGSFQNGLGSRTVVIREITFQPGTCMLPGVGVTFHKPVSFSELGQELAAFMLTNCAALCDK
jgi:hypothetical protein